MRKFITKSLKNSKFLFVCRGPGETGQGRALAKFLAKEKAKIIFCLKKEENIEFLSEDKEFKIFLTKEPKDLKIVVEREKPEFLLFFNSKIWGGEFLKKPPFSLPKFVFCFDSNWLFNSKKYPDYDYLKWAQKYFILFPKEIFELGLKEFGGNFEIEKEVKEKIFPIGFIPSYRPPTELQRKKIKEKLKLKPDEKLIFAYFSGWGAGYRIWAFENFVRAMEKVVKKRKKIKAIYVGPTEGLNLKKFHKEWLIFLGKISAKEYFLTLGSSDLVFMHQGMVTLAQAIGAKVPVICNVSLSKEKLPKIHFWELFSFKKLGLCEVFTKTANVEKIAQKIEDFLYNKKEREKTVNTQKKFFQEGEKNFLKELQKQL